jgi:hypothetical protein
VPPSDVVCARDPSSSLDYGQPMKNSIAVERGMISQNEYSKAARFAWPSVEPLGAHTPHRGGLLSPLLFLKENTWKPGFQSVMGFV